MARSRTGGATIELTQASRRNLDKQLEKLNKVGGEAGFKWLVQMLFDIKVLAQQKLKRDGHIEFSRLRNSLFVKTLGQKYARRPGNSETYTDKNGKTYKSDFEVALKEGEGAIGTNVEYAPAIEFGYGPHTIEVKNFPVLGREGRGFFGKRVQHPGFAGDSYLYWALKNVDADKRGRQTAKEILDGVR